MKKNSFFKVRLVIRILLFLLLVYLSYYFVYLGDQFESLLNVQKTLGEESSYELIVSDFKEDKCQITYCIFNNCNNVISLPCSRLRESEFNSFGNYRLEMDIGKHILYPWSDRKIIKSWKIVAVDSPEKQVSLDPYISSLKEMLGNYYLWEIYSIPISSSHLNLDNLYTLEQVRLDFGYTKSLYLLSQLAGKYGDQELKDLWQKELSYLNKNVEDIITSQQEDIFPSAYLLKLVDVGLDRRYLKLLDNFKDFGQNSRESINFEYSRRPLLLLDEKLYSHHYEDMVWYSDYYEIFLEYGYKDLSEYSYNKVITAYNSSQYSVYGVCSVQNSMPGLIDKSKLQVKLEETFTNSELNLIEGNIYELLMCKKFAEQEGIEIDGLESRIAFLLVNLSLSKDGKTILVRGLSPVHLTSEINFVIVKYDSLDNLMLLANYEE